MTLFSIIDNIKKISLQQPSVNSVFEGNIYDALNANPSIKYGVIVITQQQHLQDNSPFEHFNFNIFYADRLTDDLEENRLQIQSTAKNVLTNIIRTFCDKFEADCEQIQFQPFTERFSDMCAGQYITITLDVTKDFDCYEDYSDEEIVSPMITIRNQSKIIQITDNGTYVVESDDGFTGLELVEIEVNVEDTNGSYQEGFDDGKTEGYNDGYNKGAEEQKAKLTSISITENGTYSNEDGYNEINVNVEDANGSYQEGFDDGKTEGYNDGYNKGIEEGTANAMDIIAETAQVLNIDENGIYTTKYSKNEDSDFEVTGRFDDGEVFYNFARLTNISFKSDSIVTKNSKVEIWWKSDGNHVFNSGNAAIFALNTTKNYDQFELMVFGTEFQALIGGSGCYGGKKNEKWQHFELSLKDGLIVDGKNVGTLKDLGETVNETLLINFGKTTIATSNANGYFGMLKVDDDIYIPTENGFINYTTKMPLEIFTEGEYEFIENKQFEGNFIRTVNVNVAPKINIQKNTLKFAYTSLEEIPSWADWDGITNMDNMFVFAQRLISVPWFDTSKVTSFNSAFSYCSKLVSIPEFDTSKVTNINSLFNSCNSLKTIPALNMESLNTKPSTLFGYSNNNTITDMGGFLNLKISIEDNYAFAKLPNLTYQSCINILNGLYDFVGHGETPNSNQGKLKVHANFLSLVGEEISIGTNKGWTITA